jgi:predicted GIY-YIG superfamily endonuclease
MSQFFYVCIVVSEIDERIHYTGITTDVEQRLREHNRGSCAYTSANLPWRIETVIAFTSENRARAFENI